MYIKGWSCAGSDAASKLFYLLHGLGAQAADMVRLADVSRMSSRSSFFLPDATYPFDGAAMGGSGIQQRHQ